MGGECGVGIRMRIFRSVLPCAYHTVVRGWCCASFTRVVVSGRYFFPQMVAGVVVDLAVVGVRRFWQVPCLRNQTMMVVRRPRLASISPMSS